MWRKTLQITKPSRIRPQTQLLIRQCPQIKLKMQRMERVILPLMQQQMPQSHLIKPMEQPHRIRPMQLLIRLWIQQRISPYLQIIHKIIRKQVTRLKIQPIISQVQRIIQVTKQRAMLQQTVLQIKLWLIIQLRISLIQRVIIRQFLKMQPIAQLPMAQSLQRIKPKTIRSLKTKRTTRRQTTLKTL